jgi:hypothetical protein
MGEKLMVGHKCVSKGVGIEMVNGSHTRRGRESGGQTAPPGARKAFIHHTGQALAMRQQMCARLT